MGNQQPQKKQQLKQLTQFQVDVACLKVKGYVELNRDRKVNAALLKEKALNDHLRQAQRAKLDEYQKFQTLCQDVRFIETCNIVIRYCEIIKDQSIRICKCQGDPSKIADLMPYIESILFAADNLNLQQVMEFKDLMVFYFGPGLYDTSKLQCVDPDLKKLYKNPLPDALEVNEFALKFANKYGFSEDQLNAPGHQFSSKYLQPVVGGLSNDQFPGGQFSPAMSNQFPHNDFPPQFNPQNNFGPPPSNNNFGPPPSNNNFGPPPSNNNFGPPPSNNNFGPPPSNNNFGPPPSNNNFGPPPSNNNFGPPPSNNNFGPPPSNNNFGPPPSNNNFGPPPSNNNFGPPPSNNNFGPPPSNNNFGPPPSNNNFGPPPSNNNFGPPPSNNNFGPPPQNYGNPYQGLNQGPPILASQKMQQNQGSQNVPTPNPNNNNPNGGDLDDLEARLNRLNQGL